MNFNDIPKTDVLTKVLADANQIAQCEYSIEYIGTEHALLALLRNSGTIVTKAAAGLVSEERVQELIVRPDVGVITLGRLPMVPRLRNAVQRGFEIAQEWGRLSVGTSELLLAILEDRECVASVIVDQISDLPELVAKIKDVRLSTHYLVESQVVGIDEFIDAAIKNQTPGEILETLTKQRDRFDAAIAKLKSLGGEDAE